MKKFEYNKDWKLRNRMLGLSEEDDDCANFDGLSPAVLKDLLDLKFADPKEHKQENAPTTREFLKFMLAHPGFTAHGYVISIKRSDYRVTIEGCEGPVTEPQAIIDFATTFRLADNFEIDNGSGYCWY